MFLFIQNLFDVYNTEGTLTRALFKDNKKTKEDT